VAVDRVSRSDLLSAHAPRLDAASRVQDARGFASSGTRGWPHARTIRKSC